VTLSELEHIAYLLAEERKTAPPGTKHYLTLALRNVEAAILFEKEKEK